MDGLAHLLDKTIYPLQPFIVVVALIAWGVAAVSMIRSRIKKEKLPRASFAGSVVVFLGIIGAEGALYSFVKHEALREIEPQLSSEINSVTVNGTLIDNSAPLVAALRKMHGASYHHSHGTTRYRVVLITSRGSLPLDLDRDSEDPHEYWVFYPLFQVTKLNDVAHAFTDTLDAR